jgi:hypothetical protein
MGRLGSTEIIILAIVLFLIFKIFRKNRKLEQEAPMSIEKEKMEDVIVNIPDVCPHCKNPNTKKIRLCEWCGNQII